LLNLLHVSVITWPSSGSVKFRMMKLLLFIFRWCGGMRLYAYVMSYWCFCREWWRYCAVVYRLGSLCLHTIVHGVMKKKKSISMYLQYRCYCFCRSHGQWNQELSLCSPIINCVVQETQQFAAVIQRLFI